MPEPHIKNRPLHLIIVLALCGGILSVLLIFQHYNQAHELSLVSMMCGDESAGGCAAVNRSPYSEFLGIPLAAYGVTFYLSLALMAALALPGDEELRKRIMRIGYTVILAGAGVDLILLAIQLFSIKTLCNLCLSTYACTGVMLYTLRTQRRKDKGKPASNALQTSTGKVFLGGWILGTAGIAAASLALSLMINYRDPSKLEERFSVAAVNEFQESPAVAIDLTDTPFRGSKDAPIQIVVYSDFLCPWCRQVAITFNQFVSRWQGRVVIYYKNYPLDPLCNRYNPVNDHRGACFAALGGLCAEQQGKFWEYHDRAFEKPPRDGRDRGVINIAQEIGLDTAAFKSCLASTPMQQAIQQQIEQAHASGIDGTPRIFINGRKLPKINYLTAILASEAKRLGIPPLEGLNE